MQVFRSGYRTRSHRVAKEENHPPYLHGQARPSSTRSTELRCNITSRLCPFFRRQVHSKAEIQSPRTVMIMSLLLIMFELLQGNMESVDALMTTSVKLLKGSLTQYRQDALSPSRKTINNRNEDDVADIEHMLPSLSIMGGWTPFLKTQRENLSLWDTSPPTHFPQLNPADTKTTSHRMVSLLLARNSLHRPSLHDHRAKLPAGHTHQPHRTTTNLPRSLTHVEIHTQHRPLPRDNLARPKLCPTDATPPLHRHHRC